MARKAVADSIDFEVLKAETLRLIDGGVTHSDAMGERIAERYGIPRRGGILPSGSVNHHAHALRVLIMRAGSPP